MTKTEALQKAHADTALIRYKGAWAVSSEMRCYTNLDQATAAKYHRELVTEKVLKNLGYPRYRIWDLPIDVVSSGDVDLCIDMLEST